MRFLFILLLSFLNLYAFESNEKEGKIKHSTLALQPGLIDNFYIGKEVSARHLYFGKDTCFVSFNCALSYNSETDAQKLGRAGFGLDFFKKKEIDTIFIGNYTNSWYQVEEMPSLFNLIQEKIKKHNYKAIINYGGSMGGQAALNFSKDLNANKVLAFCPQVILENYPGWKSNSSKLGLKELFPIENGLSSNSALFIFYSRDNQRDTSYAEKDLVALAKQIDNKNLNLVPVPWACHHTMMPLQKTGYLEKIIMAVKEGEEKKFSEWFCEGSECFKAIKKLEPCSTGACKK